MSKQVSPPGNYFPLSFPELSGPDGVNEFICEEVGFLAKPFKSQKQKSLPDIPKGLLFSESL